MAATTISNSERNIRAPSTLANHKDWLSLPQDIVRLFARKIASIKDLCAFGGVCKPWRSEAINAKYIYNKTTRPQHRVPILLFPKENEAPSRDVYSLTQGQFYQLDLPETKNKCCYSSLGWLLLVNGQHHDHDRRRPKLFNPLTHAYIELPSISRKMFDLVQLKRFLLSSRPSRALDYGVMLLKGNRLVFYKPGYNNDRWIRVRTPSLGLQRRLMLMDVAYHKGEYYVLDCIGRVLIWNAGTGDSYKPLMRLVVSDIHIPLLLNHPRYNDRTFLVEFAGTLILVIALFNDSGVTKRYKVLEVPIHPGEFWRKAPTVTTLGNKTLFVGVSNSSFWIEPLDDSVCQRNCIYFVNQRVTLESDDNDISICPESSNMDIGVYHMNDRKIDRRGKQLRMLCSMLQLNLWLQPCF